MGKKILFTAVLLLLLTCALSACNTQEKTPAADPGQEDNNPLVSMDREPAPDPEIKAEPPVSIEVEATATTAGIIVNGNKVSIGAYNIDGSNYVSIRDLAYVLDGSRASFDVGWDAATKSIALTSGQAYTPNGSELAENSGGKVSAWSIVTPVLLNGEEKMLDGYTVGNTSCFAIKDIGETFDFSVGWFKELRQIVINTQKPYGEEPLTLEEEYQMIINSRPRYDIGMEGLWEPVDGLAYADVIDFSNDGTSELLLISIAKNVGEFTSYTVTFEVYGDIQGHSGSYGEIFLEYLSGDKAIGLYKGGGKTYIGTFSSEAARMACYTYYGLEGTKFIQIEDISETGDWSDEVNGYIATYWDGQAEITEEQFNAKTGKYSLETNILSFSDYSSKTPFTFMNRGILPELPELTVKVNGEAVELGGNLYLEDGYVMLPLRPIMEKAGVTVCTNSKMDTILATTKRNTLEFYDSFKQWGDKSGEYWMNFNNEDVQIGNHVLPKITGDQIWVPIKPIIKLFGGDIVWDTPTKTYSITLNIPEADRMNLSEAQAVADFSFEAAKLIASQNGYEFASHPVDEWDCGQGFKNGEAYWWMYALPIGTSAEEAYRLFDQGIDKYETVTVWSDGTIS